MESSGALRRPPHHRQPNRQDCPRATRWRCFAACFAVGHGIKAALDDQVLAPLVLHGRMSQKGRAALMAELNAIPTDAPRILLATGKLVGEGFDHPPLDTLVLAMPVSWKGTLQQYTGRLHREHAGKADVRIIDFVDTGHPALVRMWERHQRGYRAMGYRVRSADLSGSLVARS